MQDFEFQSRRIAPEVFERIKRTLFPMKNMHDDIRIIRDHPLALGKAIDAPRANSMVPAQSIFEFVDDGLEVRLRVSGAEQKEVREACDAPHVQSHQVFGLLVRRNFGAKLH